uniref:DDB1- and CUL4-associated factor 8-like n=1 Tax=Phallusia mammillata TaxID=59560 RepID=A0A6F9D9Z9_9ASCI|nr:DDB1- and CUL4-associated factor 8-like [Phallusia mammillata]
MEVNPSDNGCGDASVTFGLSEEAAKTENMDDSGFGTSSSAVTPIDEDCEATLSTENTKSVTDDQSKSMGDMNTDNKKLPDKDILHPAETMVAENVDQSKGDSSENLVDIFKDDCDETSEQEKFNPENGESKTNCDSGSTSLFKKRQCKFKAKRRNEEEEMSCDSPGDDNNPPEGQDMSPSTAKKAKKGGTNDESGSDEFVDAPDTLDDIQHRISDLLTATSSSLSSSSSDSDQDLGTKEEDKKVKEEEEQVWLLKDIDDLPKPRWRAVKELRQRQCSSWNQFWPYKVCGCRGMVKRFELHQELEKHEGCVNALHFNQSGTLLASGSDDLNIMLWDWTIKNGKPLISFDSGHRSNVFQAKFLPECGDSVVVSTARDGQVRYANISATGTCNVTKKLAQHRGSAHKLTLDVDSKSTFLSCGEDGVVFGIDLRLDKPANKLVTVKVGSRKIPLYSIHTNPARPYEFAVSGRDTKAYIFDRRMLNSDGNLSVVKTYCPQHLQDVSNVKANITCLVYNWDGSELLCSYNDEDIYLFDTTHSEGADYLRRYKGHRNNATVKGVNFYGPHSEFVVSGSDCGNIFFWEKESSRIVQLMEGDKGGVVNVLEPHPSLPVIATSGLDHEVKIWTPTATPNTKVNKMAELKEFMLSNRRDREEEIRSMTDMIDGQMLWFLMRTLRNRTRRRAANSREHNDDTTSESDLSDSTSTSSSSEDPEDSYREPRCIQS